MAMHPEHVEKNLLAARIVRAHLKKRFLDRDRLVESGLDVEDGHPTSKATDGFILLSVAIAESIRAINHQSIELVLASIPERNEQLLPEEVTPSWGGVLDQVLTVAQGGDPGGSDWLDVPTAMTSAFSFAVSANAHFAKVTRQSETKAIGFMIEWLERQPGGN